MKNRLGTFEASRIASEIINRMKEHKGEKAKSPSDLFEVLFKYENEHDAWYESSSEKWAKEDINDDRYFFCSVATAYYCEWGQFTSFADDIVKFHCQMMCFAYFYIFTYIAGCLLPGNRKQITLTDKFIEDFTELIEDEEYEIIETPLIWKP